MSPVDLFRPKQPAEKAAERYLDAHLLHTQLEFEALAYGRIEEAEQHHKAARIALKAKLGEELGDR